MFIRIAAAPASVAIMRENIVAAPRKSKADAAIGASGPPDAATPKISAGA